MKAYKYLFFCVSSFMLCAAACDQASTPAINVEQTIYHQADLGVNTANLFLQYPHAIHHPDTLVPLLKKNGVKVLRYPGGTTANFYHPKEPGYGFKIADLQMLSSSPVKEHMEKTMKGETNLIEKEGIQSNFIYPFASLAKEGQFLVLYVANLLTGTPEETVDALTILQNQGAVLYGVELGNEYYLKAYQKQFPTAKSYTAKAREFAKAIRLKFPDLPLSVVGTPSEKVKPLSAREKVWNQELSKDVFFDAVSMHFYPFAGRKSKSDAAPCNTEEAIVMGTDQLSEALSDYETQFPNSAVWVTEWNILGAPLWCNNNWNHACFTTSALATFSGHRSVTCHVYHSLISRGTGYNLLRSIDSKTAESSFNALAFQLNSQLSQRLGNEVDEVTLVRRSVGTNGTIYSFKNSKNDLLACIGVNPGVKPIAISAMEQEPSSAFTISKTGGASVSTTSAGVEPETIGLYFFER